MGMILNLFGGSYIKMIVIALLLASIAGIWNHYTTIRDDRLALIGQVSTLKSAHEITTKSFDTYKIETEKNYLKIQKSMNELDRDYRASKKEADKFSKMLQRHDFAHLVYKKPGLLERKVNKATLKIFNDFEELGK